MLRSIAFVLAMMVGIGAAVSSRFGGLLFYLWFSLFRPQEWVWIDVEAFRLSLIAGSLFVVPCLLTGVWPNLSHPISIGSLLFLATGFVAQSNAVDPATGWFWLTSFSPDCGLATLGNRHQYSAAFYSRHRRNVVFTSVSCVKFGFGYLLTRRRPFNTDIGGRFRLDE